MNCLPVNDGGAPPTAAAFRRFGVPRRPEVSLFRQFAVSSFLVMGFLLCATAMPTLEVGGGVRGLVEPGATYGYGYEHPDIAPLESFYPPTVTAVSDVAPQDVQLCFSQSASGTLQSEHLDIPLWDPPDPLGSGGALSISAGLHSNILAFPPCPLGPGGVQSRDTSSQLTSDWFLPWNPATELGTADQFFSG
ncbi:hypothetical protein CYMTET_8516 [Cymbomonas tetramitiformis]|uniref:Uncharacterized protein n=1 Tax=Cymbomonas tetramitiformis TaxID=36881 RepID=A0AAE0GTB4_9CHLO|nr:hypothetical protein CYMTET_8516 [Cymbomonas tetramitiformis]